MLDLRPRLKVMNQEQIAKIHEDALSILEQTGVLVHEPGARDIFEQAIGKIPAQEPIRIPRDLVRWAISAAPSHIQIYNRRGRPCFALKGDGSQETVFGIGCTNLHYQDPLDDTIGPFQRSHMSAAVGLGHRLNEIDLISTPGILQDLPPDRADIYGVLEMTANTSKPLVMLVSDWNAFIPALDLCEHLHGDLSAKPFIIPYVNPVTPLIMNSETTLKMDASIRRGLPIIFSNYGMSGATCPITPAGTLALLTAELLAGLVYSQLVKAGSPIILGSCPAAFDMKQAGSFYSPQSLLLNLACAEIVTSYNIPHCGTSGSGNGWGADLLASTTLCINHLTSCIGAAGMAPFVGGSFDSLVFSPELVVYADDLIGQSRRFAAGFSLDDIAVGLSDISKIGPGGDFLLSDLTATHFRDSQFTSSIWPFLSLDKWAEKGAPTANSVLKEKTCALLNQPQAPEDKEDLLAKGEEVLKSYYR
jgi:trimethylamine---corrinoid protein Co-methyltransferase